jgi:enediyne biosynthesis protein E5
MMAVLDLAPDRTGRLQALRRFAVAITVLNVLGHTVLGFEQSWAQPLVALATAYAMEVLIEAMNARAQRRRPGFVGGVGRVVDFLLPSHITGLAVAMLLYANDRLAPIAFAATVAIGSKVLVRVPVAGVSRHCLNPSNTGIAATLLLFPWVGIAPPYMFTENLTGPGDWLLPTIIVLSGTYLNTRFTRKMPLILGWLGGFVLQAVLRSRVAGTPPIAALLPMTGMAFLLFTFYMVTDPGTTPSAPGRQFAFGVSVAVAYAVLMLAHVVFGLFFALLATCLLRGIGLVVLDRLRVPETDARLGGLEA